MTITGTGTLATATASVTLSGSVTAINVTDGGAGYTAPIVTISGGGGTATPVQVGNRVIDRSIATDGASQVFVVLPDLLPTGQITSFLTRNQPGSAGFSFTAFVLRATGATNEYEVISQSGPFTVPPLTGASQTETWAAGGVPVQAGDVMAFYGQGIPLDIGTGTDILSFPAPAAPNTGDIITLGTGGFPLFNQARTYSFAADVLDTSGGVPVTDNATATVFGGVDAVVLSDGGSGYTNPTVDFDMPDSPDGVKAVAHAVCNGVDDGACDAPGTITEIVVDQPGSGYSFAPGVVIRNGTPFDPLPLLAGGSAATGTATLAVQTVVLDTFGSGYISPPEVSITDTAPGTGNGALAEATTDFGTVTAIDVTNPGSGYLTAGGIKKFVDTLPGLCDPSADNCVPNNLGQYLPLAVPDTGTFTLGNQFADDADYYEIALVQYRKCMSSSFPGCETNPPAAGIGTLLRGYVQLETPANASWSNHVPLCNERLDGTGCDPINYPGTTTQVLAVDEPQFLGPVILAKKDRPVRITFYNLLPTGQGGDLYLPTDSTLMGAGFVPDSWRELTAEGTVMDEVRNPPCTQFPKSDDCFKDNRATLHLHGGTSPWISDGTPHQWITPAGESTLEPQGASVGQVPDMTGLDPTLGVPDCSGENDGCQTFYYTNQQSARLMFYHDHAFGTTRLNVYLGEAAGYLIGDATEDKLVASGTIPAEQIPLIIQDRTFVPDAAQLGEQDPTWDSTRWGGYGDFWYHHVYMPAQNPGDPSGMSAYGRWMFGPWFWPPATPPHGPIDNPYYTAACSLDDPSTWQYDTDPFCEPPLIPGTPNISAGMEQFNDTPLVNGTAYPTVTLEPKAYRLRVLNAANDRFFNLQMYVGDPNSVVDPVIGPTEVALNPAELAAAQLDPVVFPTPVDSNNNAAGPDWIVIGSEGGFLPAPAVVDGQQPTTWITDPTRFDVGNVDKHSLLLAPAERADVVVDFSQFAGKTLILYNDAPAAFPARVPSYDYYTGAPDLSPNGAPGILPGYGPNTRTVMQIKVADVAPAAAFNLPKLRTAFRHKADGTGVFEEGQHPIIVGQAAYNSAYGTNFWASGDCNPGTSTVCDGMLRIDEQGGTTFGFNTLTSTVDPTTLRPTSKLEVMIEPKGIHDEMNSAAFDEFGRMSANMGLEVVPATPALQNIVLYPYINPPTELIDGTKLPSTLDMTPIATGDDGTQIWKITHNGVDTHPLHFHLYDVQLLNRVAWDNIITPTDPTELGWKDTVRVSPLQDTIVALRPVKPELPWELPNSIRPLNPAMPTTGAGSLLGFNNTGADGIGTAPITNQLVNFGWEYVWHCHILSHEEMDMMRPQSLVLPPIVPTGLTATKSAPGTVQLDWTDNSIADTQTLVQVSGDPANPDGWITLDTQSETLGGTNYTGPRSYSHAAGTVDADWNYYRVVAQNTVGYGGEFMGLTAEAATDPVQAPGTPIAGVNPLSLAFGNQEVGTTSAAQVVTLSNAGAAPLSVTISATPPQYGQTNDCGASLAAARGPGAPSTCTINVTFTPTIAGAVAGALIIATNDSANPTLTVSLSGTGVVVVQPPTAPTNVSIVRTNNTQATLTWTDASTNETTFQRQVSTDGGTNWADLGAVISATDSAGTGQVFNRIVTVNRNTNALYRVVATNSGGSTPSASVLLDNTVAPLAPSDVRVVNCTADGNRGRCNLAWTDNSNNNTRFRIQWGTNPNFTGATTSTVAANHTTYSVGNLALTTWYFRVQAYNNDLQTPNSAYVNATPYPAAVTIPYP